MSTYFNIALIPEDESFARTCVQLAQSNFKDLANGYLLGDDAFPHITLCQFNANPGAIPEIWAEMSSLLVTPFMPSIAITFSHIYLQPGTWLQHSGKYWAGLAVTPKQSLKDLQKAVYNKLNHLGINCDTVPENYFPHLTWARCDTTKPMTMPALPSRELFEKVYFFKLSLGQSDHNGVYLKCLKQHQPFSKD